MNRAWPRRKARPATARPPTAKKNSYRIPKNGKKLEGSEARSSICLARAPHRPRSGLTLEPFRTTKQRKEEGFPPEPLFTAICKGELGTVEIGGDKKGGNAVISLISPVDQPVDEGEAFTQTFTESAGIQDPAKPEKGGEKTLRTEFQNLWNRSGSAPRSKTWSKTASRSRSKRSRKKRTALSRALAARDSRSSRLASRRDRRARSLKDATPIAGRRSQPPAAGGRPPPGESHTSTRRRVWDAHA